MELLIESGATKSTWVLFGKTQIKDKQVLEGINPTSNPSSVTIINSYSIPQGIGIQKIHYYGAGASNDSAKNLLIINLKKKFGEVNCEIDTDILAAARAVSSNEKSIVSILGTGTNTVLFDGNKIARGFRSLGYIFGDFGSGFHLGKLLIRAYYNDEMAVSDKRFFSEQYIDGKEDLIFSIYNAKKPNFVVGSYAKFLDHCSDNLRKQIIEEAFVSFFEKKIEILPDSQGLKLNFVGSVAKVFEKELRSIATNNGHEVDKIVANPIDGLIDFHQSRMK